MLIRTQVCVFRNDYLAAGMRAVMVWQELPSRRGSGYLKGVCGFIHPHRQDEAGTAFNAVCYDSEQGIERVERLTGIKPCGKVSTRYFNV